ncbi:neuropeptides capa receptor-like [Narcine bancroftii]|uniref:neuropeptides capa receptor-like n=1 Tax=Narcine bancroftii TaxID=1343680 RepID=UPI00383138D9
MTIAILSRGKCGLSTCVTRYLVAMAAADLMLVILDLMLRHIPIVYWQEFSFVQSLPVCNVHAALLFAATDCSVWFTVTFTFDRFVSICCLDFKIKYCKERTAAIVLWTVAALSCCKNVFWYFMLTGRYLLTNLPWFCGVAGSVRTSRVWAAVEFFHYVLTPGIPFVLILLFNAFSVRHIVAASRARRRLRGQGRGECGQTTRDPEMENRRKSIILLLVISGNFILLWSLFIIYAVCFRISTLGLVTVDVNIFVEQIGFMLQLLSCCTNTGVYAVTQTKFRAEVKRAVKYPLDAIVRFVSR